MALAAVIAAGAALYWWSRAQTAGPAAPQAAIQIPAYTVAAGTLERTIRLTGTTSAERFVSLITPQLRGSRGGSGGFGGSRGGGDRGGSSSASMGSSSSSSSSSRSSSSSSSSSSTVAALSAQGAAAGSASSAGAGGGVTSTGGGPGGAGSAASSAFRAATSRVGASSSRNSSRNTPRAPRAPSGGSATLGSEGLGSTASSLSGGSSGPPSIGGSSRGGGDFMLVLQELAKPGSRIAKGEVVAEFDRQYMLNRLDDYKASVVQSEADVKKMLAELEVTRKAHEQSILSAKGDVEKGKLDVKTTPVLSAIDAERTRLALEEAEARHKQLLAEVKFVRIAEQAQMKNSELDLQHSKLELRRAEANAERMVIRAPIDGLIVMQNMFRGGEFGQIQQGDQLYPGQQFMQIVDPSSMVVDAVVNQVDAERMRVGAKARVRFDAFPDLELPAHVFAVGAITKSSRYRPDYVKEIPVKLKLDQMDPRVIPDLSVSVDVIEETVEQASVLPLASIFRDTGASTAAQPYVFIRRASGWERRQVELGPANNVSVAIRSGLQPGDVIALQRPPSAPTIQ